MPSVTLQLDIPASLAREAEARGLLAPRAIETMLREALRQRRVGELFTALDQLDTAGFPPLTEAEVQAEIDAVRRERRGGRVGGG